MSEVIVKEITCRSCKHIFGDFRKSCPACGTHRSWRDIDKTQQRNAPPIKQQSRRRRARDNDCIFCYKKGATEVCPHCSERIHKTCLSLHGRMCEQFQKERAEVAAKKDQE